MCSKTRGTGNCEFTILPTRQNDKYSLFLFPYIQNYYKILELAETRNLDDENHMWMALEKVCKQASLRASLTVGCAWHVRATSSLDAPYCMARTASWMISPAFCAIMCTPRILSVSLSATTLT